MQAENSDNQKKSKNSFLNMLYSFWAFIVYYVTFGQVDLSKADKKEEVTKAKEQEKQPTEAEKEQQTQPTEAEKEQQTQEQVPWMSKSQSSAGTINEILSSEPIRMLLGEDFAPKYRLKKQEDGSFIVMTKMLKNFTPWSVFVNNALGDKIPEEEEYTKRKELYISTTEQVENFERMVAVCLLFGKSDIHASNWGIVEKDGKKYAANLDHAQAFNEIGFSIYHLMYHYGHRKEKIVTEKFAKTCLEVIEDFEKNKDKIREVIVKEIKSLEEFITHSNLSVDVDSKMKALEKHKNALKMFAYQVKAEVAIMEGNPELLREALEQLIIGRDGKICIYNNSKIEVPAGRIMSQQNDKDGFLSDNVKDFEMLIKTRMIRDHKKLSPYLKIKIGAGYSVEDGYKDLMQENDRKIESVLLAVYNEVLEFAKQNRNKTMEEASKSQTSHANKVMQSRSATAIARAT